MAAWILGILTIAAVAWMVWRFRRAIALTLACLFSLSSLTAVALAGLAPEYEQRTSTGRIVWMVVLACGFWTLYEILLRGVPRRLPPDDGGVIDLEPISVRRA